jgi:hypothetical protein
VYGPEKSATNIFMFLKSPFSISCHIHPSFSLQHFELSKAPPDERINDKMTICDLTELSTAPANCAISSQVIYIHYELLDAPNDIMDINRVRKRVHKYLGSLNNECHLIMMMIISLL